MITVAHWYSVINYGGICNAVAWGGLVFRCWLTGQQVKEASE